MIHKDYYEPSEIIPTVAQLTDFLLPILNDLRAGFYPPNPYKYGQPGYDPNTSRQAPFIKAAELAAEIDDRLKNVGILSATLIQRYVGDQPLTLRQICFNLPIDEWELEIEHKCMLAYIAGRKRKLTSYCDFKHVWKQSKYRKKRTGVLTE